MFRKKEKANDIVNIVSARTDEIVNNALDKMNFAFDKMCELDRLETEVKEKTNELKARNEEAKRKDKEIVALQKQLKEAKDRYQELYEVTFKIANGIHQEKEFFEKEVAELKSDRYRVVKCKATGSGKGQAIGSKNGVRNGKIAERVLK